MALVAGSSGPQIDSIASNVAVAASVTISVAVAVNQEFHLKNLFVVAQALLCASMVAPGLALAQAMPATKNTSMAAAKAAAPAAVTDAAAAVPGVVYQSVFANTPTGVEMESADWKKANAEVGQFKRGHVDILKWDEAQEKSQEKSQEKAQEKAEGKVQEKNAATTPKSMTAEAVKPAAPVPTPAPTTPSGSTRPAATPQAPSVHKH